MSRTNVALVLDDSASMNCIAGKVVEAANSIVGSLRGQPETQISLVTFGTSATVRRLLAPAGKFGDIRLGVDYSANGGFTAIFDGLEAAELELSRNARIWAPDDAFLVLTITDGENNAGHAAASRAPRTIQRLQDTGKWTLAFQLPEGKADAFSRRFCVPRENCEEWETGTERGVEHVRVSTQSALDGYSAARAAGQTQSKSFYSKVKTNLAWLDTNALRQQLPDLSGQFKVLSVGAEQDIRDFVRQKTNKDLVIGSAYYQLTKEEKVQGDKRILIADKNSKAIFGGNGARQLIGLPIDGTPAKVTPGNHADFDIFVQSKSVNRRLVRGTRLLIDTNHLVGSVPTWDHTAGVR